MDRLTRWVVIVLVVLAVALNALGGYMDAYRGNGTLQITQRHAWHDAVFLLLLAITILIGVRV
jgi:hypothetical protein